MKLPRNVSGATLQASLRRLMGTTPCDSEGDVRITTHDCGEHHEP